MPGKQHREQRIRFSTSNTSYSLDRPQQHIYGRNIGLQWGNDYPLLRKPLNVQQQQVRIPVKRDLKHKMQQHKVLPQFINVPGIDKIYTSSKVSTKLLWVCAVVTFYGLCTYQLSDRISFYFQHPIAVQQNVIKYRSVEFPAVTVCFAGVSEKLLNQCKRRHGTNSLHKLKGKAFATWLRDEWEQSANIPHSSLNTTIPFLLHSKNEVPLHDAAKRIKHVHPGYNVDIRFQYKQIYFLNTRENPCVDNEAAEKCKNDCFNKYLDYVLPCRLPFLVDSTMELCDNLSSFCEAYNKVKETYTEYDGCTCPRSCQETLIDYSFDTYFTPSTDTSITVMLLFPNNLIEVITETYTYTLTSLLSDAGGSLGCCIGICLFNFVEVIEYILRIIF